MNHSAYVTDEERAHVLTHAAGIIASVVAIPWLVVIAARYGDPWRLFGGVIFGLSALLLFTTSVLYHSAHEPQRRMLLRRFDHSAIYLLIAGTYTPFTLGLMRGHWGWTLFIAIWTLAVLGIAVKTTSLGFRFHKTSVLLYVVMGWLIVLAAKPAMQTMSPHEFGWLVAGGVCYTAGVPFYLWKGRAYAHAIWHVFVLAGVACHFIAILSIMDAR
ncbi:MAG TPA: hemolysin III family protein [Steroidobacteraceae bacterium]